MVESLPPIPTPKAAGYLEELVWMLLLFFQGRRAYDVVYLLTPFTNYCLMIYLRAELNLNFYGTTHTVSNILSGRVAPPLAAAPLYEALSAAFAVTDAQQVLRSSSSNGSSGSMSNISSAIATGSVKAAGYNSMSTMTAAALSEHLRPLAMLKAETLNV